LPPSVPRRTANHLEIAITAILANRFGDIQGRSHLGMVQWEVVPALMPESAIERHRCTKRSSARDHHLGRRAIVSYNSAMNYGQDPGDGQSLTSTL
jgi:hypothetical protein